MHRKPPPPGPGFEYDNAPIHVGPGAWIAARAVVLRGVTIPADTLVPAGARFQNGDM